MAHMGDPNINQLKPSLGDEKVDMIAATTPLQVTANEIRNAGTDWASNLHAQGAIQRDIDFLVQLDRKADADLPDRKPDLCGDVFENLLNNTNIKDSTMHYVLVMLDDVISNEKSRVKIFLGGRSGNILQQLQKLRNLRDPVIQHMSACITAKLACWHPNPMDKEYLHGYLSWLMQQLKSDDLNYNQSVIRCLQMMLRVNEYRFEFLSQDGIKTILAILASGVNFQIQYQLIYCLWVLTFNPVLAESLHKTNAIPILANIVSETRKEKVTRIVLAVFRNLIEKPRDPQISKENCITMVHSNVLKQLSILEQKRSNDEDIMNDVEFVTEQLLAAVQSLSSFDKYATEVKSGNLYWSPMHKSAKFWRENAARLNEPGQDLLLKLVKLLQTSGDPGVLAVACYDVGEYVRHYPKGKVFIEDLGGKESVMLLLSHTDPNVRYEALLAVQKLMVQNWVYLGKQLEKEQMEKQAEKGVGAKA